MHEAAEVKERACAESIRCRGLREDARGPAVRATDAAGPPVLPRPVWGRVGRASSPIPVAGDAFLSRPPVPPARPPVSPARPLVSPARPPVPLTRPSVSPALPPVSTALLSTLSCSQTAQATNLVAPSYDTVASTPASSAALQEEDPSLQRMRLELRMYAMVRETRPELSHEQAREMAATCSRESLPVAAPPADHFPALAPPPFIPPPLPMAPPPAPTSRHPAPAGPFAQESAPGYYGGPRFQQHQEHRGPRGQHLKRCEEDGVLCLGVGSRGESTGARSVVPPVAVTDSSGAPVVAAPVDPSPAPVQPAETLVVPPLAPTPAIDPPLVTNTPTARIGAQGHDMSTDRRNATQRAYARLDTGVLMPIPHLPFASDHNVSELVQFTSALRDAASSPRLACDDPHPYIWTTGWEKCLERHVLRCSFRFAPGTGDQIDDRGRLFPGRETPKRGSARAGYPAAHYPLSWSRVEQSHACGRDASFAKPGGAGRHPVQ